jgi:hypothetical protein
VPRKDQKRCVILNPKAGSVKDLDAVKKQLRRLKASSFHLTKKEGAAKAFAREAVRDHCDEIIAAGGDGTLNEVINGIAKRVGRAGSCPAIRAGIISPAGVQLAAVISTPDNHFAAVLRCGGGAEQDLVIEDEVLLFRFLKRALKGLGEAFEVFIAHAVFGFDHGDVPDRGLRYKAHRSVQSTGLRCRAT